MMKLLLKNGNMIDTEHGGTIRRNTDILIDDGKIQAIGKISDQADRTIELSGAYVLPGLINAHVHLFGEGKPAKALSGGALQKFLMLILKTPLGAKIMDKIIADNVQTQLKSGVTTIRAVGDFCHSDIRVRDKIKAGKLLGPRMLVSGPAITVPGGHGDGTFARTSNDIPTLLSFVEQNVQAGVDLIKICVTGGVMDAKEVGHPGELKMNLQQTKAVCDKAHEFGLRVASHTESEEGLEIALRGGVDTIEHGAAISDALLDIYKAHNAAMIVTFSPCVPLALLPPEITKLDDKATVNTKIVGQGMIDGARKALENDVAVGCGTDAACPLCTQYNTWRELQYLSHFCGLSPAEAICTATLRNAQILDIGDLTGSVTVGKAADILVVKDNPTKDLSSLGNPLYVLANGKLLEKPKQKKRVQIEQWLDSINLETADFTEVTL